MTTFDTLIERNQEFAAHHFPKDLPLMPTLRAIIIGCVDPRVDPAHVFGLGPGEAIVIRNVGGRITPATLETMGMLGRIAQGEGGPPAGFHLVVLHHNGGERSSAPLAYVLYGELEPLPTGAHGFDQGFDRGFDPAA